MAMTNTGGTYPYNPYSNGSITITNMTNVPMMAGGGGGGFSGNPSQNLEELKAVQEALRQRKMKKQHGTIQQNDMFQITDNNEERLFKPLLPANRYVHEDDHLEWLKGRTRSVCSRVKWAKETYAQ